MAKVKEAYWKIVDQMVNDNTELESIEGCECGCNEQENNKE